MTIGLTLAGIVVALFALRGVATPAPVLSLGEAAEAGAAAVEPDGSRVVPAEMAGLGTRSGGLAGSGPAEQAQQPAGAGH